MEESKAALNYNAFESLKSRFAGNNSSTPAQHQIHTTGTATTTSRGPKRLLSSGRHQDGKLNAPPLVPLVEEGDLIQECMLLVSYNTKERGEGLACS